MNEKAQSLGLKNSHFSSPHGLDKDDHYTTATELALLTTYALKNQKFSEIIQTKQTTVYINNTPKAISNTNELLGNLNGVYGVKTGFTNKAGRCLVTSTKRGNLDVVSVVLGANTKTIRTQDSIKAIEYTFKNFEMFNIKERMETAFENWFEDDKYIEVVKGTYDTPEFALGNVQFDEVPINKKEENDIETRISYSEILIAPILENQVIGAVYITIDEHVLGKADIYVKNRIDKKNMLDYFIQFMCVYKAVGM